MNKNLQEGVALAKELTEVVKNPNCGVIICTPFIHLASVAEIVKDSAIELGAENCADKVSGAFTGGLSSVTQSVVSTITRLLKFSRKRYSSLSLMVSRCSSASVSLSKSVRLTSRMR